MEDALRGRLSSSSDRDPGHGARSTGGWRWRSGSLESFLCPFSMRHGPRDLGSLSAQQRCIADADSRLQERRPALAGTSGRISVEQHSLCTSVRFPARPDHLRHRPPNHKIITGRQAGFPAVEEGGPVRILPIGPESPHDWVENSHATVPELGRGHGEGVSPHRGGPIAISLTGGMAWEALIAVGDGPQTRGGSQRQWPTVGGLATHLATLRTDRRYEPTLKQIKQRVRSAPLIGGRSTTPCMGSRPRRTSWCRKECSTISA